MQDRIEPHCKVVERLRQRRANKRSSHGFSTSCRIFSLARFQFNKVPAVARICFKHWLKQSNVLFIIGGKSNNTDIFETFRAMADALREHFGKYGAQPLYVVVGRGGPNLVRGMGVLRDTCESLGIPYRLFGFDSAMSEVVDYAKRVDAWMKAGGRAQIAAAMKLPAPASAPASATAQARPATAAAHAA